MKKLVKVKSAKKGAARRGAVQLEPNKFLRTLYVVSGISFSDYSGKSAKINSIVESNIMTVYSD